MKAAEQLQKELACSTCEGKCPDLLPENLPAWRLWMMVQTQWRVGFSGPIGLDYLAVMRVAEIIGVEMCEANVVRIQALEAEVLKFIRGSK